MGCWTAGVKVVGGRVGTAGGGYDRCEDVLKSGVAASFHRTSRCLITWADEVWTRVW